MSRIAVMCPTRDRPREFCRFVRSVANTSTEARVHAYIDEDQMEMYADQLSQLPEEYPLTVHHGNRVGPAGAANGIARIVDAEAYGLITDDSVVLSTDWDKWMLNAMHEFPAAVGVVSPSHNQGPHVDMPFVSKGWLDRLGYFAIPGTVHYGWPTAIHVMAISLWPSRLKMASNSEFFIHHDQMSRERGEDFSNDAGVLYNFLMANLSAAVTRLAGAQ